MTTTFHAWGSNSSSQLSDSDDYTIENPFLINSHANTYIKSICFGYEHTVYLLEDGSVYARGSNSFFQLASVNPETKICRIDALNDVRIISIVTGAYHSGAIDEFGRLYTWGCNINGQLGWTGEEAAVKLVTALKDHKIVQVSMGVEHTIALTDTCLVYVWGDNSKGQTSPSQNHSEPRLLVKLLGLPIRQISAGGYHNSVITPSGSYYSWGWNDQGQIGTGTKDEIIDVPTLNKTLKKLDIIQIENGEKHSLVLTRDGKLYAFGMNRFGQLGLGGDIPIVECPTEVIIPNRNIIQIASGRYHTVLVTMAQDNFSACVSGFGFSDFSQLGPNTRRPKAIDIVDILGSWSVLLNDPIPPFTKSILKCLYVGGDCTAVKCCEPQTRDFTFDSRRFGSYHTSSQQIAHLSRSLLKIIERIRGEDSMDVTEEAVQSLTHLENMEISTPLNSTAGHQNEAMDEDTFSMESLYHQLFPFSSNKVQKLNIIMQYLDSVYSSFGCLSSSCLVLNSTRSHYNVGRLEHGMDIDLIYNLQNDLFNNLPAKNSRQLINSLLNKVLFHAQNNYPSIETIRSLFFISLSPLIKTVKDHKDPEYKNLILTKSDFTNPCLVLSHLVQAIGRLEPIPSKIFDYWLELIPMRYFSRLIANLSNQLIYILSQEVNCQDPMIRSMNDKSIKNTLDCLRRLYTISNNSKEIPCTKFYIPEIKDFVNLEITFREFLRIKQLRKEKEIIRFNRDFAYFDYNFIFDAECKTVLLNVEANFQMMLNSVNLPFFNQLVFVLELNIDRNNLIQDTITQLQSVPPSYYKRKLKIKFKNEEAEDAGGVLKEFFLLIMREILNPIFGMFVFNEESRLAWFNEFAMESEGMFSIIGVLCGLAIYNSTIIDINFPSALFKKLLNEEPDLEDLKQLMPTVGNSLQQILDYDGDDFETVFDLDFTICKDQFGQNVIIDLVPDGANKAVTLKNRHEYVKSYIDYTFNISCKDSYKSFHSGFHLVCQSYSLKMFRPFELQDLMVGSDELDWSDLRKNTIYEGEYWDRHPIIEMFWELFFNDLNLDDKKKFLKFLTGCDRVPVIGFFGIKIRIQPSNGGDEYLPVAHTCSNLLDLPKYSNKEKMKEKLLVSIQQTEGFALV